jgi:hypothetical protein
MVHFQIPPDVFEILPLSCRQVVWGGFYHDDRFATLPDVVEHHDGFFELWLTDKEERDLSEYLKSL